MTGKKLLTIALAICCITTVKAQFYVGANYTRYATVQNNLTASLYDFSLLNKGTGNDFTFQNVTTPGISVSAGIPMGDRMLWDVDFNSSYVIKTMEYATTDGQRKNAGIKFTNNTISLLGFRFPLTKKDNHFIGFSTPFEFSRLLYKGEGKFTKVDKSLGFGLSLKYQLQVANRVALRVDKTWPLFVHHEMNKIDRYFRTNRMSAAVMIFFGNKKNKDK